MRLALKLMNLAVLACFTAAASTFTGTPSPDLSPIFGTLVNFDDKPTLSPVLPGDYAAMGVASVVELEGLGTFARYPSSQSLPNYIGTGSLGERGGDGEAFGFDGTIRFQFAQLQGLVGIGKAILLLLARLGLRAGEVAQLKFADIDWRNGSINVCGKGRRQESLPLPQEVGNALLLYLNQGRPSLRVPEVFTSTLAPFRALTRPAVTQIARIVATLFAVKIEVGLPGSSGGGVGLVSRTDFLPRKQLKSVHSALPLVVDSVITPGKLRDASAVTNPHS